MAIFGMFGQQRKPRQFNLKYRYYDEHKERLKESEARVRKQLGMEVDDRREYKPNAENIHNAFRSALEDSRRKKRESVRLGIAIGLFIIIAYLFVHYVL